MTGTHTPGQATLPTPNSTKSYWHKDPSKVLLGHRTTPSLPTNADLVIIGSGISGASAAHFLHEKDEGKNLNIVMLEAREACWGATGRVSPYNTPLPPLPIYQHPPERRPLPAPTLQRHPRSRSLRTAQLQHHQVPHRNAQHPLRLAFPNRRTRLHERLYVRRRSSRRSISPKITSRARKTH